MNLFVTRTLVMLASLAGASGVVATTYAVGPVGEAGCSHDNLRDALVAAANDPAGPHLIKVSTMTDTSLSYSGGSPDSAFAIADPMADITVEGGYPVCTSATPIYSLYTVVEYASPAVDHDYPMLQISNGYGNPRRSLTLRRLHFDGSDSAASPTLSLGGGILIQEHVTLNLGIGTRIRYFEAGSGGGVALLGAFLFSPVPPIAKYPTLHMSDAALISYNHAADNGGGVYALVANVVIEGGDILENDAGMRGGGIYASGVEGTPDNIEVRFLESSAGNSLDNNRAGVATAFASTRGYGGGLFSIHADIDIAFGSTTQINDNQANFGGAMYVQGIEDNIDCLSNTDHCIKVNIGGYTEFRNNLARGQGGALYSLHGVRWLRRAASCGRRG